jgi:cyclic lactone autoinducer peptide
MKVKVLNLLQKLATPLAALAMMVAIGNAGSTCLFMAYQPDMPDELNNL